MLPEAILEALVHWRLHAVVLTTTFVVFPLLGVVFAAIFGGLFDASLAMGIVFLTCVPSTVQSSIAFTALARGNVAAAVGAAAMSNMLGVVLTPALVALLVTSHADGGGAVAGTAIRGVALQLLLPFVLGQLALDVGSVVGVGVSVGVCVGGVTDTGGVSSCGDFCGLSALCFAPGIVMSQPGRIRFGSVRCSPSGCTVWREAAKSSG